MPQQHLLVLHRAAQQVQVFLDEDVLFKEQEQAAEMREPLAQLQV
jgi:hypothetical protein